MSVTSNCTQNTTTLADYRKPVLLELYEVESYTYAIRYSCRDSNLWNEIKDTIMSFDRSERRYDPDEFNGKGAWVVSEYVLDELTRYFPSTPAWLAKTSQPTTAAQSAAPANIEDCPF